MLAAVLVAGLLFPLAGGFGFVSNRAADAVDNVSAELVEGTVPAVSTMVDAAGNPIAWLYEQRRFEVPSDRISNDMKLAIISIEDRRFADHDRSEEHTSELQSRENLVCRLLLEKKKTNV